MPMNYHTVRSQIKAGDLIAISHYEWASWSDLQVQAIRFGTRSEYSHVALVIGILGDRLMIVESVVPVIRTVPLSNLNKDGFYWFPLPAMTTDEYLFLMSRLGKGKYSKWQAITAFLKRLAIGADELWECAELVIAARKISGVDLGDVATPSAVVRSAQMLGAPSQFVIGGLV